MASPPLRFLVLRWRAIDFVGAPESARVGRRRTPGAIHRAITPDVPRRTQRVVSSLPPGRILLQQPQNKVFERRRDIVLMRREQFGLIVKNRVRNRDLLITTEWLSAREHLVEHDAECP